MFNIPEEYIERIKKRVENPEDYIRAYIQRDGIFLVYQEIYLEDLRVVEEGYLYVKKSPFLSGWIRKTKSPMALEIDQMQVFIKKYLGIDVIVVEEIKETFKKLVWLYASLKELEYEIKRERK